MSEKAQSDHKGPRLSTSSSSEEELHDHQPAIHSPQDGAQELPLILQYQYQSIPKHFQALSNRQISVQALPAAVTTRPICTQELLPPVHSRQPSIQESPSAVYSRRVSTLEPPSATPGHQVSNQELLPITYGLKISAQESQSPHGRRVSIQELLPTTHGSQVSVKDPLPTAHASQVSTEEPPPAPRSSRRVSIQEPPPSTRTHRVSIQEPPPTTFGHWLSVQGPPPIAYSCRLSVQGLLPAVPAAPRLSVQESLPAVPSRQPSIQDSPPTAHALWLSDQESAPAAHTHGPRVQGSPLAAHAHQPSIQVPPSTKDIHSAYISQPSAYQTTTQTLDLPSKQTWTNLHVPPSITQSPEASVESFESVNWSSRAIPKESGPSLQLSQGFPDHAYDFILDSSAGINSARFWKSSSRQLRLPLCWRLLHEAKKISRQLSLVLNLAGLLIISLISLGQPWMHFQVPLRPPRDPAGTPTVPINTILFVRCSDISCLKDYDQYAYLLDFAWIFLFVSSITSICVCVALIVLLFFTSSSPPMLDFFLFIGSIMTGTCITLGVQFYLWQAERYLQEGMTYKLGISFYLAWIGVFLCLITGFFSYLNYMNFWSILALQAVWT